MKELIINIINNSKGNLRIELKDSDNNKLDFRKLSIEDQERVLSSLIGSYNYHRNKSKALLR